MEKTPKAIKTCKRWLQYCLNIGWSKESIDGLEKLWWERHDGNGNLVMPPLPERGINNRSKRGVSRACSRCGGDLGKQYGKQRYCRDCHNAHMKEMRRRPYRENLLKMLRKATSANIPNNTELQAINALRKLLTQ